MFFKISRAPEFSRVTHNFFCTKSYRRQHERATRYFFKRENSSEEHVLCRKGRIAVDGERRDVTVPALQSLLLDSSRKNSDGKKRPTDSSYRISRDEIRAPPIIVVERPVVISISEIAVGCDFFDRFEGYLHTTRKPVSNSRVVFKGLNEKIKKKWFCT